MHMADTARLPHQKGTRTSAFAVCHAYEVGMLTHAAQVSVLCKERGALLLEVWQAHATLLRTVHAKLQVSSDAAAWTCALKRFVHLYGKGVSSRPSQH